MTVHKRHDGSLDLMVSQPGGAFVTLLGSNPTRRHRPEMPKDGATGNQPTNLPTNTPNPSGGMTENGINAPSTPESPTECR